MNDFPGGKVGCKAFSYQFFDFLHELLVTVCYVRDIVKFVRHFG